VRAQLRQDSLRGDWLRDRVETRAGIPRSRAAKPRRRSLGVRMLKGDIATTTGDNDPTIG